MIQSIQDAFRILDTEEEVIPIEAIEFLYEHDRSLEIEGRLLHTISHAADPNVYYDENRGTFRITPFWYMIIAENHLTINFIEPLIRFFSSPTDEFDDLVAEQACFLVGRLCQFFPTFSIPRFFDALENILKSSGETALSFYLYDILYFVDIQANKERLLAFMELIPVGDLELVAIILTMRGLQDATAIAERRISESNYPDIEEEEIEEEESEEVDFDPEAMESFFEGPHGLTTITSPWVEQRPGWKEYLLDVLTDAGDDDDDDDFWEEEAEDYLPGPDEINLPWDDEYIPPEHIPETINPDHRKIGKNDPYPCGSGNKFKDCCEGKGIYD
jgi:hypothetical protein